MRNLYKPLDGKELKDHERHYTELKQDHTLKRQFKMEKSKVEAKLNVDKLPYKHLIYEEKSIEERNKIKQML